MYCCLYSATGKTVRKFYTSETEDHLAVSVFTFLSSFSLEIGEMLVIVYFFAAKIDGLKVQITFFLFDLKYSRDQTQ